MGREVIVTTGREVLIKSIIQAIPTFIMGCFKLPIGLCNDIESLVRKFWWGQHVDRRKIHWLWWDELTKSKWSGLWQNSMISYWQNKLGYCYTIRILFSTISLRHYFPPNCSIMGAKDLRSGSYAGWSILKRMGCYSKRCPLADWEWKKCEDMAASMAS